MHHSSRPWIVLILLLLAALILSVGSRQCSHPSEGDLCAVVFRANWRGGSGSALCHHSFSAAHSPCGVDDAGGGLSGWQRCGVPGLFRNPLADPYLIGVASGGGLGAITAMTIRWPYTTIGMFAVPLAAFAGALLSVLIVYRLARVGRTVPTTNLLLAGVAISSFTTALTSFLLIHSTGEPRRALVWMMGGSTMTGWQPVLGILPYALAGLILLLINGFPLNVMQFGDEQAQQMGVRVEKVRRWIVLAASLATAAAVAFAGVIGFVGLVVPHLIRLVWGGDYRRLLPLSMLGGLSCCC